MEVIAESIMDSPPAASAALALFAAAAAAASADGNCLVPLPLGVPEAALADMAACLSPAERERAERFRRPRDRRRYLVAHAGLRQLLAQRLGVRPERVALGCNPCGKPELQGRQAGSGWRFSLSYSDGADGGLALCALSRLGRIGVDVEAVRRLDDAESLARHFFSRREYDSYRELAPDERPLGFLHWWTRKEAVVKALGTGLSRAMADVEVSLAPGQPARILSLRGSVVGQGGWRLASIGPVGGRVAAVASESTEA